MGLVHQFTSGKAAAVDATVVDAPNWDANHYFTGGNLGALLYQGTAGLITNLDSVAAGQVLASAGAGSVPAWTASPSLTSIVFLGGQTLDGTTADITELRRTTNPQTLLVNNTRTDGSNYERGFTKWTSNIYWVGTEEAGTGTPRQVWIGPNGAASVALVTGATARWLVNSSGHLLANTDNTYDIGASGATRPRNLYLSGQVGLGSSSSVLWNARSGIQSPSDGVLLISNNASTDFSRLQLGGTTSSFPALKRSSAQLQVKLADDSAFASIQASEFQTSTALVALGGGAAPTLGTIGGSGPATAAQNTWLRMVDSAGAAFWVPVWK